MHHDELNIIPTESDIYIISYIDPITRLRIRKEFNFKDAIYYQEYATELYIYKNRDCLDNSSTIRELLGFYYQNNPQSILLSKRGFIRDFVNLFGEFRLVDLKQTTLKKWLINLQEENSYSYKNMINLKSSLNLFFRFLIEIHLIDSSPLSEIQFKKINQKPKARVYLTATVLNSIISLSKKTGHGYYYPLFLFFKESACKSSELILLRWEQLNLESKSVYFYKNVKISKRELPLSDELCALLEKKKRALTKKSRLVFTNIEEKQFSRNALSRLLNDFKRKNNILDKWTFCDFRHSFAKAHLKNGKSLEKLKYILGHDSIYTTRQIYSELLEDFKGVSDNM